MAVYREKAYGVTPDMYDATLATQGGVCAICGKIESARTRSGATRALAVDHCHRTGRFRGVVCLACNTLLGLLEADPLRLEVAVAYLTRYGALCVPPPGG